MNISPQERLKQGLHTALGKLEPIEQCALIDYPEHLNLGDHLIWLGSVLYLTDVMKTKINYAASITDFSGSVMEKQVGKAPIFFHGGGSLGDIWPNIQEFREQIIAKYRDRPIIILPQSIYFASDNNFKKAAKVFNAHPNLTLFTRDNYSYELALQYFDNCQVIKAPDMALQMLGMLGLSFSANHKFSILYHCRGDRELNQAHSSIPIEYPNLVIEDWISYKWVLGTQKPWPIQSIAQIVREGWQRGLATPKEGMSRQMWQHSHPYTAKFNTLYKPSMHRRSWSFMHSGIYQFKQHNLIITNRLHGHILCVLLGIPHVFLPNSYHKNEGFYETWTSKIPFCRFVKDNAQIKQAGQELLELFPSPAA